MTDVSPFSLKPKDAIAFARQKGLRPAFSYLDVWTEEHSKDFTVAKVLCRDLLQDYKDELDKQQEDGMNFEAFRKAMLGHLKEHGMDGPVQVTDPDTGEVATVNLSSKRRLRTVFSTNMRQAYNQGNWQRAWATKDILPYMVYHHSDSVRFPRVEHEAWNLICLPIGHPFWKTHYPQCAWGCQCWTESVNRSILAQRGWKITADKDIPVFPVKEFVNRRTGEVSHVEQGIDPAFNYNVGTAPLRGITARPLEPGGSMPVREVPGTVDVVPKEAAPPTAARFPLPIENGVGEVKQDVGETLGDVIRAGVDAFLGEFGASAETAVIVQDRVKWPVVVGEDLFRNTAGDLVAPRPDLMGWLPRIAKALKLYDRVEVFWAKDAAGKSVIVRRYIKQLDNHLITIDFSGKVWTYDVQPVDGSK